MKIHPYIIAGIGRKYWISYSIRDGNAEIEAFPAGRKSIPLVEATIERQKSLKALLGLGTIKITSVSGSVQEWTNVPHVDKAYEALLRASKGQYSENNSRKLLTPNAMAPRSSRSLCNAKNLMAFALLDEGKQIITSEEYGDRGYCLAVYHADSLKLVRELVFADGVCKSQPNAIAVVGDPDLVIVDIADSLYVVDLRTGLWVASLRLEPKILDYNHAFWTGAISLFDGGRLAAAHCGVAGDTGHRNTLHALITFDVASGQLKKAVWTQEPRNIYESERAGVADPVRRQFITGTLDGWLHVWDIDSLTLARQWHLESPSGCTIPNPSESKFSEGICSMAISSDYRILAVGTACGAIHLINVETGKDIVHALVPSDFDYTPAPSEPEYAREVTALEFFADDKRVIARYTDGSLRVWDLSSGFEVGEQLGEKDSYWNFGMVHVLPHLRRAISIPGPELRRNESNIRICDLQPYF